MMNKGTLGGPRIVSASWVHDSTTPDAAYLMPKPPGEDGSAALGYAYQWWVPYGNDGVFMAQGIFGQMIYVNPTRHVVIVQSSAWPEAVASSLAAEAATAMDEIARQVSP